MKKLVLIFSLTVFLSLPWLSSSSTGTGETMPVKLAKATRLKGKARIHALLAYIKNPSSTSPRWGALARYHLALTYHQTRNHSHAVTWADQALDLSSLEPGEEGRLLLIIALSYAAEKSSIFDKNKALACTRKAISHARSNELKAILNQAQNLLRRLNR